MLSLTDVHYSNFSMTDAYYPKYAFSDLVLLSGIGFFAIDDGTVVGDSVQFSLTSNQADSAAIVDEVVFDIGVGVVDSVDAPDQCSVEFSTRYTDACSIQDYSVVTVTSNTLDTATTTDSTGVTFTLYIATFIALNEQVRVGQNSLFDVNNAVRAIDDSRFLFTDSIPPDSTSVSDSFGATLRPLGSSILGRGVLGNFALGA